MDQFFSWYLGPAGACFNAHSSLSQQVKWTSCTHSQLGSIRCSSSQGGVKGEKKPHPLALELTHLWLEQHLIPRCWRNAHIQPQRRLVTNKYFSNTRSTNSPFSFPQVLFKWMLQIRYDQGKKGQIRSGVLKGKCGTYLFPLQRSVLVKTQHLNPINSKTIIFFWNSSRTI